MKSLLAHDTTKSIAQLSTHLDLDLPNSSIVIEPCRHVQEIFEPWLFNHVVRSWFFAALLARSRALKPDAEVFAVAALFHDLGLATKPDQEIRFEVVGAGTAYDQIKKTDLDAIVAAFPRLEMKARMKACLCRVALDSPRTTYDNTVNDFGKRFVETYQPFSIVDALQNSPFSE